MYKEKQKDMVNIKTFWNGTVISDLNIEDEQFNNQTLPRLKEVRDDETFRENQQKLIDYYNNLELKYKSEYEKKGEYEISNKEMYLNMLIINDMVNEGIIENDNNFGLLIASY